MARSKRTSRSSHKREKRGYNRALRRAVRVAIERGGDVEQVQVGKQYIPVEAKSQITSAGTEGSALCVESRS